MYDNCMFCQRPLGSNEVVEPFPVGRRLAFDEAKGRLWVVCPKCERWNLTPLEERWEAVEECERIFRDTRVRVSTENIGLCRHPEGLALVRIGKPLRPEFAAWRYGDQFGRRRRKAIAMGTLGAAAAGAIVLVGLVPTGIIGVAPWLTMEMVTQAKLRPDQGPLIKLSPNQLTQTRIGPAEGEPGFKVEIRHGGVLRGMRKKRRWFEGEEARRFAVALLPHINSGGGSTRRVRDAVAQIETAGTPQRFLSGAGDAAGEGFRYGFGGLPGYLHRMPTPTRLALEMALHEEQERRALEGELWLLERAWREAEEIAEISDNLLQPEGFEEWVRKYRSSFDPRGLQVERRGEGSTNAGDSPEDRR